MAKPDLFRQRFNAIRDSTLSLTHKATVFIIADHAGLNTRAGECFASMDTLASELNLSKSQTYAVVKEIEKREVFKRTRRKNSPSVITINWERLSQLRNPRILMSQKSETPELSNPRPTSPETQTQNSERPEFSPYREHSKNTPNNTHRSNRLSTSATGQAEQIYEAYPKLVGKKAALKAISKALKERPYEELMDAVTAYAAATVGADRQFIPHPATWFNAGRYEDDRTTWVPKATNGDHAGLKAFLEDER